MFTRFIVAGIIAILIPAMQGINGMGVTCHAQKDPDAVQSAMAILIHRHSVNADTIATEISQRFKKSAPMQTALARAYYRNNERAKTKAYLAKAIQADENYSPAYILYGDMYGEWNVDSATYWFDKAIIANPTDPDGYIKYANVMSRVDMDKAKARLEALRRAVPSYNVDVEIAALYNKKGDDKAAVAAFANADLETLTMHQMAQYLQNCYWANDDTRGIEVAQVATRRFPQNFGFNRVYAWCAARSGDYDTAIKQAEKWFRNTRQDSINSIDHLTLGSAYLGKDNIDKAFSHFLSIKEMKDDYFAPQMPGQIARLVNNKLDDFKNREKYDAAATLYGKYIEQYPSDSDPAYQLYTLAQIYREQQDKLEGEEKKTVIQKMFDIYGQIEDKYPQWENIHIVLYTHARWLYAYFDEQNEQCLAEPYYKQLYDLLQKKSSLSDQQKGMIVEACQYLASTAYFQRKDLTTARQWWSRILTYDPDNQNAREALAKIKK